MHWRALQSTATLHEPPCPCTEGARKANSKIRRIQELSESPVSHN